MYVAFLCEMLCCEIGRGTQGTVAEPFCLICISLSGAHSVQLAAEIISLQAV